MKCSTGILCFGGISGSKTSALLFNISFQRRCSSSVRCNQSRASIFFSPDLFFLTEKLRFTVMKNAPRPFLLGIPAMKAFGVNIVFEENTFKYTVARKPKRIQIETPMKIYHSQSTRKNPATGEEVMSADANVNFAPIPLRLPYPYQISPHTVVHVEASYSTIRLTPKAAYVCEGNSKLAEEFGI